MPITDEPSPPFIITQMERAVSSDNYSQSGPEALLPDALNSLLELKRANQDNNSRHILHIYDQSVPPKPTDGGSNRLIDWLARAQCELGYEVTIISPAGSSTSHYAHVKCDVTNASLEKLLELIPNTVTDIEHHGGCSSLILEGLLHHFPRLITVYHAGEGHRYNPVYVSASHARGVGEHVFVHNAVPDSEIRFKESKSDYFLFLGKVKRSKKGAKVAVSCAKKTKNKLIVAGGRRLDTPETWFHWHPLVKPVGFINGQRKKDILANAKALLVPIQWDEPFGLTVLEAMLSGTPVIAFKRGAMSELIEHGVSGFLCETESDMMEYMEQVEQLSPDLIRNTAREKFSVSRMASEHLDTLSLTEFISW